MIVLRFVFVASFLFISCFGFGQTTSPPSTSATDHKVRIEKSKRARATSPRKDHEVRFADKNRKKAVGVKEREPVVYKNNKKMQKRSRQRANSGKLSKKRRRTPLPNLD